MKSSMRRTFNMYIACPATWLTDVAFPSVAAFKCQTQGVQHLSKETVRQICLGAAQTGAMTVELWALRVGLAGAKSLEILAGQLITVAGEELEKHENVRKCSKTCNCPLNLLENSFIQDSTCAWIVCSGCLGKCVHAE